MRIRVLGTVGVERAGGGVEPLAPAKPRTVLALLAARRGSVVSAAAIEEALWPGGSPRSARTAVQTYVSQVRSFLDPGRARRDAGADVQTVDGGYVLDVDVAEVDAACFEQLVATGRYAEALALWQPPFGDLAEQPWAQPVAAHLEELRRTALEESFALALVDGRHAEIVGDLQAAIAADPYRERLVGQLVLALYRCGRQADALAVHAEARRRLADDLGLEPSRQLVLLEQAILAQDPGLDLRGRIEVEAPPPAVEAVATSFVGRRRELADLASAAAEHRLVTVTGPGGAGKTRLVREWLRSAPRAWFVDLGGVRRDDEVAAAVARALRVVEHPLVPIHDQFAAALCGEPATIVLDTCEHVVVAAAVVASHVLAAPGTTVVATSRRPLRVPGERVLPLGPLDEAVDLLLERAGLTEPTDELADVCRRLDGLPLAIELAASRLGVVAPPDLTQQVLGGRADGTPRHRALDATIRWSVELLDAGERDALALVAAFAGSFTPAMAEALGGRPLLRELAALAEQSLLAVAPGGRYRVLDTVRAFARAELWTGGEGDRHADWVLALARGRRVAEVADEVAAALDHLEVDGGGLRHLELAARLGELWNDTGRLSEGRARLRRALDADRAGNPFARTSVLAVAGRLAWFQGDYAEVDRLTSEALALAEAAGDDGAVDFLVAARGFVRRDLDVAEAAVARALDALAKPGWRRATMLNVAALIAWFRGDEVTAAERFHEQADNARRDRNDFIVGQALRGEGVMAAYLGDADRGWTLCSCSLTAAEERGDDLSVAQSHAACAVAAAEAGAGDEARRHAVEALARSVRQFDTFALGLTIPVLAAGDASTPDAVARLIGWSRALQATTGVFAAPRSAATAGAAVARATEAIGPAEFARLAAAGAGLSLAELAASFRN